MTQPDALIDFICNLPLFESLSRNEAEIVAAYVERQNREASAILFHQWDKAECVYFVEQGALEVLTKSGPDEYEAVALLQRGRSIGEMSLIDNFPRAATVQVKCDATLVRLTQSRFETLLSDHLDLGIKILKSLARLMARNLRKTSSRLADNMLPMG